MGQFTQVIGAQICFDTSSEEAQDNLIRKFTNYFSSANGGELDGGFNIYDEDYIKGDGDLIVIFSVDSMKYDNCLWQVEEISKKAKELGAISFNANIMTSEECVSWSKEDEDEQNRRDEKNGLYGDKEDAAN